MNGQHLASYRGGGLGGGTFLREGKKGGDEECGGGFEGSSHGWRAPSEAHFKAYNGRQPRSLKVEP